MQCRSIESRSVGPVTPAARVAPAHTFWRRGLAGLALCLTAAPAAWAQGFPNKPIKIIVHSSPGGQLDVTSRQVAQGMSEIFNQSVVVENRPGADGLLGIRYAKSQAADGYSVLAAASTIVIQPWVKAEPGYDVLKDFTAVGPMLRLPYLILTATNQPYKNVADVIAAARANPDKLSFASGGTGSTSHLGTAMLMQQTGMKMLHVPYKGNAAAMPDLIAGRADFMYEAYGSGSGHIKSGRLKVLGVTSTKRLAVLPDVPTVAELGVANYSYDLWLGLLAPAGTPRDAIQKLADTLRTVLTSKKQVDRVREDGAEQMVMTPEEFTDVLRRDLAQMGRVIGALGLPKE